MDDTFSALRQLFLKEAGQKLKDMDEALTALEAWPSDQAPIGRVLRDAHALTRGSAALGFESLAGFGHVVEELLEGLHGRRIPVTGDIVWLLLRAVADLRQMVPEVVAGREEMDPASYLLLEELRSAARGAGSPPDRPAQ